MNKISAKERKIIYELSKNARLSATKIARKVGVKKDTVVYTINNLLKKGKIKRLITLINTESLGFTRYEIYLQLSECSEAKEKEIARFLAEHPMSLWVRSALGKWDILSEFYARDIFEYEKIVCEINNKFKENIRKVGRSIVLFEHSFPLKCIGYGVEEPYFENPNLKLKMDEGDFKILREIAGNARIGVIDISKKTGINPDTIVYRMKSMEKNKLIIGYRAVVNDAILGLQRYKIILKLRNIDERNKEALLSFLKNHKSTQYVKRCTGEWDFSITLLSKDVEELRKIILDIKNHLKDALDDFEVLFLFEEYKNTYFPIFLSTSMTSLPETLPLNFCIIKPM